MSKLTKFLPQGVRDALYPYKPKLTRAITFAAMQYEIVQTRDKFAELASNVKICDELYNPLLREIRAFAKKYGIGYKKTILDSGWNNPGAMFDELGEIFKRNRNLLVIGEESDIERIRDKLDFLGIDIDCIVVPVAEIGGSVLASARETIGGGYTVIAAYLDNNANNMVIDLLKSSGNFFTNVNLFSENDFTGYRWSGFGQGDYLSIFAVYVADKVYIKHNCILVTTVCNLNCRDCLNFAPYNRHPKHFELDDLKKSVDTYFEHVDKIGLLQISGGEPMLASHLKDLLEYIQDNYGSKIGELQFVTNGTVIPSEQFCAFLAEYHICVVLDDYTVSTPDLTGILECVTQRFEKYNIEVTIQHQKEFFRLFPPTENNVSHNEYLLKKKYNSCRHGYQNYQNGKLSACNFDTYAMNIGLLPDVPEDWLDLASLNNTDKSKKMLIEFRLGFSVRGYCELCKYCNGHTTINNIYDTAAIQSEGKLDWDYKNPTCLEVAGK